VNRAAAATISNRHRAAQGTSIILLEQRGKTPNLETANRNQLANGDKGRCGVLLLQYLKAHRTNHNAHRAASKCIKKVIFF
jgi:hypothetical protein